MRKTLIITLLFISYCVHSQSLDVYGNKTFKGTITFSRTINISGQTFSSTDVLNAKTAYSNALFKTDTSGNYVLTKYQAARLYMPISTVLNTYSRVQVDSISALKAPLNSPTFTGTVSGISKSMVGLGNVTNESKATMFTSPTFTGNVILPSTSYGVTQSTGNNTTLLATTSFVQTAISTKANLNSPTFTGTPILPIGTTGVTQEKGTVSTRLATTEFVDEALSDEISLEEAIPFLDGIYLPQKFTAEIDADVPTQDAKVVWDKELKVVKIWDGSTWKTLKYE